MDAADIDRDGDVNAKDRMLLARFLAGWEGYDEWFTGEEESEYVIEFQDKEAIEEELAAIKELNGGELPEIMLDEEDMIPGFISGQYSDEVVTDYDSAKKSLEDIQHMMRFDDIYVEFVGIDHNEFKGTHHYRLQQMYKGVPVYGKQLIVTTDENGVITALSGNYDPLVGLMDETINLTAEEAYAVIAESYPGVGSDPELVVYTIDEGWNEYAWIFTGSNQVFVSAIDAAILLEYANYITTFSASSEPGIIGDQRFPTAINNTNNLYAFFDINNNIEMRDANNEDSYFAGKSRTKTDLVRKYLQIPMMEDEDNIWLGNAARNAP